MEKKFFVKYVLSEVYAILNKKQKQKVIFLFFGICFNGILDLLGLAAILGALSLAISPEKIFEISVVNYVYELFEFTEADPFIIFLISCLLGLFIFKTIVGLLIIYQQKAFAFSITEDIVTRMFSYYFSLGYSELKEMDTGTLLTNIRNVPNQYVINILHPIILLLTEVFVAGSIVIGIALINFKLLIFLGSILGIAFVLIYRTTKNRAYNLGQELKFLAPETLRVLTETIIGHLPIKLLSRTSFFRKKYIHLQGKEFTIKKWMSFYNEIPAKINEFLMVSGIFLLFLYALVWAENRESFQIMLGTLAVSAYRIMPSLNRILKSLVSMKKGQYLIEIIEVLKNQNQPVKESKELIPFQSEIVFSNLSFSFKDSSKKVLEDISFKVKKGEQIGLIGESGSGKTTLMKILLGILEGKEGRILIDGKELNFSTQRSWQQNIGYVQQDVFLIDGTLAENIAFGIESKNVDKEKVLWALKLASLEDFLETLPSGIDSYMGEYGSNLSGGQRQRIAIARAIYTDAELFIFDEATSALDSETEQSITESISLLKELGKTSFIIAHRYTTLKRCDVIYELENGKIAKKYDYQELIKDKLGLVEEEL